MCLALVWLLAVDSVSRGCMQSSISADQNTLLPPRRLGQLVGLLHCLSSPPFPRTVSLSTQSRCLSDIYSRSPSQVLNPRVRDDPCRALAPVATCPARSICNCHQQRARI
ncbi:hypothetical protein DFJ77DRAFT_182529 [Powellomyces hirtus]|nr:hypothetical protein DFJ77DRAFT_182529 [Powellomyces hirtus]